VDVPNLRDKVPDTLPQSELNPLTNPALERNLGRWAQVYFSNPPEKRERAVSKLLEEIRREASEGAPTQPDRPYFARAREFEDVVCPVCQRKNPPRHKYCAGCGEALNPVLSESVVNPARAPIQEPAGRPTSPLGSEAQWLRDRAFGGLDQSDVPQRSGWKYVVGGLVIALAGFAYLQWAPGWQPILNFPGITGAPRVSTPKVPRAVGDSSSTNVERPPQAIPPDSKEVEVVNPPAPVNAHDQRIVPAGLQTAVQKSTLFKASLPSPASEREGGVPDLRLAQRYLGGSMGVRDSSEAAKLLWKSVRQQNATAALLLSDLYVRGDGVPKSCEQARLLLVAAAKRGAREATQGLRTLESHGCQ
jgi:hypothetical protein